MTKRTMNKRTDMFVVVFGSILRVVVNLILQCMMTTSATHVRLRVLNGSKNEKGEEKRREK